MPHWYPNLYLKYGGERTQPAIDLLSRIALTAPQGVIDLGCGPGNSTSLLHARWPDAAIEGLDSSAEMIATASATYPDWTWSIADISTWAPDHSYDLIFSNAALQWVPDHARLIPGLFPHVAPGGALAIQMPAHFQSPVHRILVEVAEDLKWRHLTTAARSAIKVERPAFYYDLLSPVCSGIDLWETEYLHHLRSHGEIVEWMRGTGLRPFLEALQDDDLKGHFEARFLSGLEKAYSLQKDGSLLFPFRRLFFIAYRSD